MHGDLEALRDARWKLASVLDAGQGELCDNSRRENGGEYAGGGDCVSTICTNGSNDDALCSSNGDCTGGGRCGTTTDCLAQCYNEAGDVTGSCLKQSDCADGERCRGICDQSDECVKVRNGAPLPLSSNGTSVCIDSQFFTNITGTRNIITGTLNPQGMLKELVIEQHSGAAAVDKMIVAACKKGLYIRNPPADAAETSGNYRVRVEARLQNYASIDGEHWKFKTYMGLAVL